MSWHLTPNIIILEGEKPELNDLSMDAGVLFLKPHIWVPLAWNDDQIWGLVKRQAHRETRPYLMSAKTSMTWHLTARW